MRGFKRTPWQRYIDNLYKAPAGSVVREIADAVSAAIPPKAIVAYLDDLMVQHPESDRRHEVAWELRWLMRGVTA